MTGSIPLGQDDYRLLIHMANDPVFILEPDSGRILDANLQASRMTGYTVEELVGMSSEDLHSPEAAESIQEFERLERTSVPGLGPVEDLPFRKKSGSTILMNVSSSIVAIDGRRLALRICRDVTRIREVAKGLSRYMQELVDGFQEKTRLLTESQSLLVQAEKMASLGALLSGVAHEINTPLSSIVASGTNLTLALGKIRKVLESLPAGSAPGLEQTLAIVDDSLRTNRLASEHMVNVVRSLRNFGRLDEIERRRVDIHEGIENTLILMAHELKGRIKVVKDFGAVSQVSCFPNQLNQVFMNILMNAAQSIEGSEGEIRIRTWEQNGTLRVAISDNGRGIPPGLQSRLFEPGFTTKKAGSGTGLGLSICRRIIEDHGGHIEVVSEAGRGTTFTIVLPTG